MRQGSLMKKLAHTKVKSKENNNNQPRWKKELNQKINISAKLIQSCRQKLGNFKVYRQKKIK